MKRHAKTNPKSTKKVASQLDSIERRELLRLQPISYEPLAKVSGHIRFAASSALGNNTISIYDIVRLPGFMAATTTSGYNLAVAVRLRKMRIWGFVATAGTPVTVSLQKAGIDSSGNDFNDSFSRKSDTSVSFDRPAYIEMNFEQFTPSGAFHTNAAVDGNVVNITCPAGAIVDFHYTYVMNYANAAPTAIVLVGANVGTLYHKTILGSLIAQNVNATV